MALRLIVTTAAAAAVLAGCSLWPPRSVMPDSSAGGAVPLRDVADTCRGLAGQTIEPGLIGANAKLASGAARIDSATWQAAAPLAVAERGPTPAALITPATPAYCKVLGQIAPVDLKAPPILFQINLPAQWNGRSVQYGGGGFNGTLISGLGLLPAARFDQPAPLARGYATYGTDSGHQNKPGEPPQTFALNDEAALNFFHASYKKVRDVAVVVMGRAYGRGPEKLYFAGSSEGGREGLMMAQRYPADFDGVFARVPVLHWTGLQFAGTRNGVATMGEGWIRPAQVKLVHEAVLAACDASDGLADGLVSDAAGCRGRFDVMRLRCGVGQGGDSCLNDAQLKAVQTLHSPYRFPFTLANGLTDYPGWGVSGEDTLSYGPTGGWSTWWLGKAAPAVPPAPDNSIAWVYGAGALQYVYARDPKIDPRQVTPEKYAARVREVSALMDATNPDLSAFHARGGKLIVLENMADYAQSPYAGIGYVESVQARMGAQKTAEFVRLFTAPGVDHVGSGAPSQVDMLQALADWVEKGRAPAQLQLVQQAPKAPFTVQRAHPLCEWPAWPRYQGSGDANAASSFACTR
ncbi:tannase/feruloyl esterase family alpha/beta hydrolase [Aquabacterium sp. OR-4]|uniref:tannase/feruloyl esterase family alpha/beta hydrolase n=1 Tax=Aquabacterium sp. OR-4 TaxID=2978127 RepID=UPI0028C8C93F|nr:tannase/feruloyl esterase family alpha/beta hydrolase [Aquabacterium sp. OR-4]MDT7834639.1 tannase/feruloyl esterase family alpha/beta hydrolase [Aquabacterium sp. OR-4]